MKLFNIFLNISQNISLDEVKLILVRFLSLYKTFLYCNGNLKVFFLIRESKSLIYRELIVSLKRYELNMGLAKAILLTT